MIISKTPIRVSFFGGGTDYPDYYKSFGGKALSTTIDKYIYITVKRAEGISDFKYKINYSKLEACNNINEIQHPVVKACLTFLEIDNPLEIHVISDLPAKSGTGSSSSFTVGLLNALYCLKDIEVTKEKLANDAIHIEQVLLNERVGVQDQLAAAYGGFNEMTFNTDESLVIKKMNLNESTIKKLDNNLLMFYTGVSRFAHQVLEEQIINTKNQTINSDLLEIKNMVQRGIEILIEGENLNKFGLLLDEAWERKKLLSNSISSNFLDQIYNSAKFAGAIGGKLLGAGGGGFFVFYVDEKNHEKVRRSLANYAEVKFNFENLGSRIILND
jgi:D-glycero-alpha-D-manno-heptose-7-phosphate kinase